LKLLDSEVKSLKVGEVLKFTLIYSLLWKVNNSNDYHEMANQLSLSGVHAQHSKSSWKLSKNL